VQVVAHPSPLVLEEEVLDRVAAAKTDDPLAPVLVVVPSRRLAEHVARRLVERFGVVLGVEILHHAALAGRILEMAGAPRPRVIGEALLERVTSSVVRDAPPGALRDFIRKHPVASGALRGSLSDLREAGIAPGDAGRALDGEYGEFVALYTKWVAALDALLLRGASDHTAVAVAAAEHAPAFARPFRAVLHHGAYELIGVHDDLVRALDRGREVVFLLPSQRGEASGALGIETSFLNAQGATAELDTAARGALAAVSSGVPPHEVAIVVRSFGPYAAAMDALLDADDLRWHTSYTRSLRRVPEVARALRALAEAPAGADATFGAHAAAFEVAARETFGGERWEEPAGRALGSLIARLGEIETLLDERRAVPRKDAFAWLDARVDAETLPPEGADAGGIRILDAMQARGLTFRHVALVGMNAGVFPRVGRDDPLLPDAARGRLAAATGRPLRLAAARDGEEHLILSMVLGCARERLAVSWRRADEAGRPVVPSLSLRDIARATAMGGGAGDVERAAAKLPAHPRSRIAAWAARPGLLRRDDETLYVALSSEIGLGAGRAVASRLPQLSQGVSLVEATDAFAPGPGAYDGRVGPGRVKAELAATALERLGACPLQFFFRDLLQVTAESAAPTPFEADFAAVGRRVHDVLHDVYDTLVKERVFERIGLATRIARAKELLHAAWQAKATAEDAARAARYPVLDGIESRRWIATLGAFVEADLTRMEDGEIVPIAFEHKVDMPIPDGPEGLIVHARFDRIVQGDEGAVVGDYKTRGNLDERIAPAAVLSGAQLQVPLYALLQGAPVELLGVGPKHVPGPGEDPDPRFVRFDGFKNADHRAGMLETLRVLAQLAADGRFPLRSGPHCGHCDYAAACRKNHPPTEHREQTAPDVADARDCWQKKDKLPTLAAVRAGRRA
jgi:hypothetical protein